MPGDGPSRRRAARSAGATPFSTGIDLDSLRQVLLQDLDPSDSENDRLEALVRWRDALLQGRELRAETPRPSRRDLPQPLRTSSALDELERIPPLGSRIPDFAYYGRWKRLLARVAARVVLFLARILTAHQRVINTRLREMAGDAAHLANWLLDEDRSLRDGQDELYSLVHRQEVCGTESQVEEARQRLVNLEVDERLSALEATLDEVERRERDRLALEKDVSTGTPAKDPSARGEAVESRAERLDGELEELRERAAYVDTLERRLEKLERLGLEADSRPRSEPSSPGVPGLDDLLFQLSSEMRGSESLIKQRLEPWMEVVEVNRAGTEDRPILDLGPGRGEWLQMLRDRGLYASGVDSNVRAVSELRARGLTVHHADALEHLRRLRSGSIGMVTAFHLVEHLRFEVLVALLDEIHRVLLPQGVLLLETPNPDNLLVGASSFHCDPTHRTPLPAPLLERLLAQRGFMELDVRLLRDDREGVDRLDEGDCPEIRELLNRYLAAPMDYAILGIRPE
jgi:SAM-dependent methyltransferase